MFFLFTGHARQLATSGGPIFRCTTKDRGERRASSSQAPHPSFCLSGQKLSRSAAPPLPTKPTSLGFGGAPIGGPLNPRGNVLEEAGRAVCLRVRNSAFDAIKSRMACSALLPCALRAAVPWKIEIPLQPPAFRLQIRPVIQ